jgi:hypothetical protein
MSVAIVKGYAPTLAQLHIKEIDNDIIRKMHKTIDEITDVTPPEKPAL